MYSDRVKHPACLPVGHPPVMLVIVDTEEEFDWGKPFSRNSTGTTSIAAQALMHERVFYRHGVVPTYVIDYPVATAPAAIATLRGLMEDGRCEIGSHLHPWVSPPHEEVVSIHNSYAGNLPPELEFAKLQTLTQAIGDNYGKAPIVFKAGRYGVGPETGSALARLGYLIDASVVPYTSFCRDGGPDFSWADEDPYWFEVEGKRLLELPVSTAFSGLLRNGGRALYPLLNSPLGKAARLPALAARSRLLERIRLTPEGCSADEMIRLIDVLLGAGCPVLSMTYHSPSLAVGHTPYVRDQRELDVFLASVDAVFQHFSARWNGKFMSMSALYAALAVAA